MILEYAQEEENHRHTTGMALKPSPLQAFQLIAHCCLVAKLTIQYSVSGTGAELLLLVPDADDGEKVLKKDRSSESV